MGRRRKLTKMAIYPFFCRMAADRVWNETLCVWSLSGCVVTWWSWSAPSPPHCVERSVVAGLGMPELAMSKAWKCVLAKVCLPFCMLTSEAPRCHLTPRCHLSPTHTHRSTHHTEVALPSSHASCKPTTVTNSSSRSPFCTACRR